MGVGKIQAYFHFKLVNAMYYTKFNYLAGGGVIHKRVMLFIFEILEEINLMIFVCKTIIAASC